MFGRMSFEQKILALNAALFVVIAGLSYLLITTEREVPSEPPFERIIEDIRRESIEDVTTEGSGNEGSFANFGVKPALEVLIPRPTPSPTPRPTPVPDPKLADAIRDWQVKGVMAPWVMMGDKKKKDDEWTMDVDNEIHESTKVIRFEGKEMEIRLEAINEMDLTATFSYTGREGKQTVTKSVFDDM